MSKKLDKTDNKSKPPKFKQEDVLKTTPEALTETTGATDNDLIMLMLTQVISSLPEAFNQELYRNGALAMLHGINPKNELEGMLAAQMTATHILAMETAKRAMLSEQSVDGVDRNINRTTKLMRTFNTQIEALQKLRGKGQKITVQHVTVNDGGKAVVGDIQQQGGG